MTTLAPMEVSFTAADIADICRPRASRGATTVTVRGLASLRNAVPGDLSFLGNPRYKKAVAATRASIVLLPADFAGEPGENQLFLLVENPSIALAAVCARIEKSFWPTPARGIHPSAVIAGSADISPEATVGPLCVVGEGAVIATATTAG